MKRLARAALVLVTLAAIAAAGATGVRAADPDLIGGRLSATPTEVTLLSQSTVPVEVVMTADGPFTLTPDSFTLDPGETSTMVVTGDATGRVSAAMHVITASIEGESSSVTLDVAFPTPAAPDPLNPLVVLGALSAVFLGLVVVRRVRPWEYRLRRSAP